MQTLLQKIISGIVMGASILTGTFGYTPPALIEEAPQANIVVGASNPIPSVIALFETTLANGITDSATTMQLSAATDKDGNVLASSTYPFVIDEGTAVEEFIVADCTGVTCTNLSRGVSVLTGTSTVSGLNKAHRRGATVKITDGPILLIHNRILSGIGKFPNILHYTTHPTFTQTVDIVDKKYVDDTAFSGAGVVDATAAARGVVELATQLETASSSSVGSSGNLVIPSSNATSTYNSATAALRVVVTQNSGKIDSNFLPTITATSTNPIATSTTVGNPPIGIMDIGKNAQTFLADGNFNVPQGITKFHVLVLGGGGGGSNSGGSCCSSGGSAGGFLDGWFNVTGTTSVRVIVGAAGGANGQGGTSYFGPSNNAYASSTGGMSGSSLGGTSFATTSSALITSINGTGAQGHPGSSATGFSFGGMGGSSPFGGGGQWASAAPNAATGYGAGGSGGGGANNGAAGTQGFVRIEW